MTRFSIIFSLVVLLYASPSSSYMQDRIQLIIDRFKPLHTSDAAQQHVPENLNGILFTFHNLPKAEKQYISKKLLFCHREQQL